jgi:hypothetical protein
MWITPRRPTTSAAALSPSSPRNDQAQGVTVKQLLELLAIIAAALLALGVVYVVRH